CGDPRRRFEQLRKVAGERQFPSARDVHVLTVLEEDGPEAVPLGLVLPAWAIGKQADVLGLHWSQRGLERQLHSVGHATLAGRKRVRSFSLWNRSFAQPGERTPN